MRLCVVGIRGRKSTPEEILGNEKTAAHFGRVFQNCTSTTTDDEAGALAFAIGALCLETGALREPNSCAVFITSDRDSRAARWLAAECLRRGILPLFQFGSASEKRYPVMVAQARAQLLGKMATDPIPPAVDIGVEVPSMAGRNVLVVGIDTCHTNAVTTGACVGILLSREQRFVVPTYWRNEVRGQEMEQVTRHFAAVIAEAQGKAPGSRIDDVVVFQDGNVFSELEAMQQCVPSGCNYTHLCLHKRTNIRFLCAEPGGTAANMTKGTVVHDLTPVAGAEGADGPASFYLQCHDCFSSTARTVQFLVHRRSDTLPLPDVQKLAFTLASVGSPLSTKLPLPTRCAHRISALVERMVDACPTFCASPIPEPLRNRTWFL
jgi:hypothetical protein